MSAAGASSPPGQAVILCGGLGARLGALTSDTPKPLLSVGGRPFLDVLLFELGRHGVRRVLLLAAFQAEKVAAYARDNPVAAQFGMALSVAVEPNQAGTGGALWHAQDRLEDRFFLLNGDSWFDINLLALSALPAFQPAPAAVMGLRALADGSRYGVVTTQGDRVTGFNERPEAAGPALVNTGVYLMTRSIVTTCAGACSLERDVLPVLIGQGRVRAVVRSGFFIDIGVPESFALAQTSVPAQQRRPAVLLGRAVAGIIGPTDRLAWSRGVPAAVRRLNDAGLYVFLLPDAVDAAASDRRRDWLGPAAGELAGLGAHIDDVPEAAPAPAMLRAIASRWPLDLSGSVMISETTASAAAARAIGLKHRPPTAAVLGSLLARSVGRP